MLPIPGADCRDRKSTRLNSSHLVISYAVFCLKKKAPTGTGTTIAVALQLVGLPPGPLNVTGLLPCLAPKFVPVIVTSVPFFLNAGDTLVILAVTSTVTAPP